MRFRVLACDYDNTLATHGVTTDAAVAALRNVAASGRRLVLVTGRILEDLSDVFADLDVFDLVVAENGGVLHDPATGGHRLLGPPLPAEVVNDLRDAGIQPISAGRVMCSTPEHLEPRVAEVVRRLGLRRNLIRNKDSLMVLPEGVDKVSGLRVALEELQEPLAAVVAVGDAENDVALLEAAGAGVAVGNALEVTRRAADVVLDRANGDGVRRLCQALVDDDLVSLLQETPAEPEQAVSS